jgi:DNA-binding FadR family transcriptional regulator
MRPLKQSKLHEQLAAELSAQIVSGRIAPGAAIPSEPELVAEYGVSKTVVRETVQALSSAGLVRIHQGKRTTVLAEEEWNILHPLVQLAFRTEDLAGSVVQELYAVRIVLEPAAARWAWANSTAEDIAALQSTLALMEEALASGDTASFLEYDRVFHFAIADASGNRVLRAIVRDIHEVIRTSWLLTQPSQADMTTVYEQHSAIATAISGPNEDVAAATMKHHLEWASRTDRALANPQAVAHSSAVVST